MRLEDIGFYTLSDERARFASSQSPLWRCELILTDRCNFRCPYCRGVKPSLRGDISIEEANRTVLSWSKEGLKNIRFSGGEPTLWGGLVKLVSYTKSLGVGRIAISTNGSARIDYYRRLIEAGVNDISVSLDSCCAATGKKMCGGIEGAWERVVENIKALSRMTYVTVGMVLDENNIGELGRSIEFADSLGVADIRIIPSAQYGRGLPGLCGIDADIFDRHPILKYRINNLAASRPLRGLSGHDSRLCYLVRDDIAACSGYHFPCIIYLREGGSPIGEIGPDTRSQREEWFLRHDSMSDPICRNNCLDVCVDYNNKAKESR